MKKTAADINATTTILGLVSRISNGFLDVMEQYKGERTPAAVGEMAHKVLQVADKVNHTDGSRLFFWCNWSTIGAYLLKLEETFGKE
jgi:hypothetical protein